MENYIRELLVTVHYSDLPDIILIEFFCDGINQPLQSKLRREGPRSSLSQFMDYALLTVGSLFTVGVAEEECDITSVPVMGAVRFSHSQAPGHSSLLIATPGIQPARKMAATPERAHIMATIAEPVRKMAATTTLRHVTAAIPESRHVTADRPESRHVSADRPESRHVSADLPESRHVTADHPESSHVTSQLNVQSLVTLQLIIQSLVMSLLIVQSLIPSCLLHADLQGQFVNIPDWHPAWRIHRWCQHKQMVSLNQCSQAFLFLN